MRRARISVVLALVAAAACETASDEGGAGTGGVATSTAPLPCEPGTRVDCPCTGGGTGQQLCASDGARYEACAGCPLPTAGTSAPAPAGTGGTGGSVADASTEPDAGSDAGPAPDTRTDAGARLGPSCGVGLPILCTLGTELCCVRSLATDTCVPADPPGGCTCDLAGCEVLEVRCDGPEDCAAGEVCCGTLAGGTSYVSFACTTECRHTSDQRIACHEGMDTCPTSPTPHVCANSQLLTNVQVCIDPATIEQ